MYRILYLPTQEFLYRNQLDGRILMDPLFRKTPLAESLIRKNIIVIAEFKNYFLAEHRLIKDIKKWSKLWDMKLYTSQYPELVKKYPSEDITEINFYTILWIDHV